MLPSVWLVSKYRYQLLMETLKRCTLVTCPITLSSKSYQNPVYENRYWWRLAWRSRSSCILQKWPILPLDPLSPSESCSSEWLHSDCCQIDLTELNFAVLILACIEGCYRHTQANSALVFIAGLESRMVFSEPKSVFFMKTQGRNFSWVGKMKTLNNWSVFISRTIWVF